MCPHWRYNVYIFCVNFFTDRDGREVHALRVCPLQGEDKGIAIERLHRIHEVGRIERDRDIITRHLGGNRLLRLADLGAVRGDAHQSLLECEFDDVVVDRCVQ